MQHESAVIEERHIGAVAAHAADFLAREERAFHNFELLKALQADPDAVLIVGADAGEVLMHCVVPKDYLVPEIDDLIAVATPLVNLVSVGDHAGVSFRLPLDGVDITVFINGILHLQFIEECGDKPYHIRLLARGRGDAVQIEK